MAIIRPDEEDEDPRAYVEFLERPNIWQNKTDYIKELVVNLLTTGISIQAGNFFESGDLRPRSTLFNLEFNNQIPRDKRPLCFVF